MDAASPAHFVSIVNLFIVMGFFNNMEQGTFKFAVTGLFVYLVSFVVLSFFLHPYEKREKELTKTITFLNKKNCNETLMLYHHLYLLKDFAFDQSKINGTIADFTELSNKLEREQKEFDLKYSVNDPENI